MRELFLTAQEIIYLCALSGAKEVPGVEDVFMSVPAEKLVVEATRIKDSLIEKGCLEMDFDGNCSSTKDADTLVDVITRSDKRIAFFSEDGEKRKYGMLYVKKDMVCLSERSDDPSYRIKYISPNDIFNCLMSAFQCGKTEVSTNDTFFVNTKILESAKTQYANKKTTYSKKVLIEAGIDENTAELLLLSYGGKASLFSVKLDNLAVGDVYTDGLFFMTDGETAVDISVGRDGEEDILRIRKTNTESEKELLKSLLGRYQLFFSEVGENE